MPKEIASEMLQDNEEILKMLSTMIKTLRNKEKTTP